MAELRLIADATVGEPALDAAISHALMLRVAAGELPDTLRISRPGPSVAFGKRDVISPGYAAAIEAVTDGGFAPIERLAGGRAAAFHEQTIHVSHSIRHPSPRDDVTARFDRIAALIASAFASLGVDAHVGELAGEYCPGAHSVNARHATKLMGLGQRVVKDAANLGAVIVVSGAGRIRDILTPVYSALDLPWRPETTGSLTEEVPTITWGGTVQALEAEYGTAYMLEPAQLDDDTLALARRLEPDHISVPR